MAKYRTAQGRILDMSALAAANERTRAVGNMPVNARGDTIDSEGRVVVPVTKKVGEKYQKTVMNKKANLIKGNRHQPQRAPAETAPVAPIPPAEDLTAEELELESSLDEDLEIEKIKAQQEQSFTVKPASEAPDFFKPE
jgi:hypothetical protein